MGGVGEGERERGDEVWLQILDFGLAVERELNSKLPRGICGDFEFTLVLRRDSQGM